MTGRNDTRAAARVYAALLWLYPAAFRRAFGAQMLRTFMDEYAETRARDGRVGVRFWLAAVGDLAINGVKERSMTARTSRILTILAGLGVIAFAGLALFGPGHLPALLLGIFLMLVLLALVSAALLLVALLRAGGRGRVAASVILVGVGALAIFGAQGAVRSAPANTWCITTHAAASQPPVALTTAADYFQRGDYDYDRGDCDAAIADYSQAITLDPAFAEAYNNRAYTYMMRQEYDRALPDLDRAIQLRPDYAHALMNRGDIYNYYYQIDRARAIADYDRVIALGPTAMHDSSVCGHRWLAVHNGWNAGTLLDFPRAASACSAGA